MKLKYIFIVIIIAAGCRHREPPASIKPVADPCDPLHVSYKNCIKPVLKNNCYSCHSDSASGQGNNSLDLENFNELKSYLNIYFHNDSIYGSKFLHVINQVPGVIRMPPVGKLKKDELDLIRIWISAGAPFN